MIEFTSWEDPIIGLEVKPFNWRLRKAREARGWTRKALADAAGLYQGVVGNAEKLRPVSSAAREKLALTLQIPEDELFPGAIDALPKLGPDMIEVPFTEEQVTRWQESGSLTLPGEEAEHGFLREAVEAALWTLSPREAKIVRMRFGLDGAAPRTREDIAREFDVTGPRVNQIEAQALRKLRRLPRDTSLRPFYEGSNDGTAPVPQTRNDLLRFVREMSRTKRDTTVTALSRVILEQHCCLSMMSPSALRVHIIEDHAFNDPRFWPKFETFVAAFSDWAAAQRRSRRAT